MLDNVNKVKEQLFSANTLYTELHQPSSETKIVFNDLVQLAKGNRQAWTRINPQQVMEQINQSLLLRRQYMSVLQALCFAYNPQQAAASSGLLINSRKSSEFELLYKVDKNFSGQVYVILKVPHPSQAHMDIGPSVNSCSEQVLYSVPFPPMVEGKSQLLMDDSDQRFLSIFDANFEIYLS